MSKSARDTINELLVKGYTPIKQVLIESDSDIRCVGISWKSPKGDVDVEETAICEPIDEFPGIMLTELYKLLPDESTELLSVPGDTDIEFGNKIINLYKQDNINEVDANGQSIIGIVPMEYPLDANRQDTELLNAVNNLELISDSLKLETNGYTELVSKEATIDELLTSAKQRTEELVEKYNNGKLTLEDIELSVSETLDSLSGYPLESTSLTKELMEFSNKLQETQKKLTDGIQHINSLLISHNEKYKEYMTKLTNLSKSLGK